MMEVEIDALQVMVDSLDRLKMRDEDADMCVLSSDKRISKVGHHQASLE